MSEFKDKFDSKLDKVDFVSDEEYADLVMPIRDHEAVREGGRFMEEINIKTVTVKIKFKIYFVSGKCLQICIGMLLC